MLRTRMNVVLLLAINCSAVSINRRGWSFNSITKGVTDFAGDAIKVTETAAGDALDATKEVAVDLSKMSIADMATAVGDTTVVAATAVGDTTVVAANAAADTAVIAAGEAEQAGNFIGEQVEEGYDNVMDLDLDGHAEDLATDIVDFAMPDTLVQADVEFYFPEADDDTTHDVEIFEHEDCTGTSQTLQLDPGALLGALDLGALGHGTALVGVSRVGNDRISSIRVKPGKVAVLFGHAITDRNFSRVEKLGGAQNIYGKELHLQSDWCCQNMPAGWNDVVSHVEVRRCRDDELTDDKCLQEPCDILEGCAVTCQANGGLDLETCDPTPGCHWDDGQCWSAVGNNTCDTHEDYWLRGCEVTCQANGGLDEDTCDATIGCEWDDDQCWSYVGSESCDFLQGCEVTCQANGGLDEDTCDPTPGCQWDDGQCWSAVGYNTCDTHEDYWLVGCEVTCQANGGLDEVTCDAEMGCKWVDDQCKSAVEQNECNWTERCSIDEGLTGSMCSIDQDCNGDRICSGWGWCEKNSNCNSNPFS